MQRSADTVPQEPVTTSVPPVISPPTSPDPIAPARGGVAAVTVASAPLAREATVTAAVRAPGAASRVLANETIEVVPVSAPTSVTAAGAAWRTRKTVPVGGQSVEDLLAILERSRRTKAASAPANALEVDDEESDGHSSDENEVRLDELGSKSDVTSESSNPFCGSDNSDHEDDDNVVVEEGEDEPEDEEDTAPLPLTSRKPDSKKGRGKGAKEVIENAPSKNSGKKANVRTKKAVTTGVSKRVPIDKSSESSAVKSAAFYVKPKAKQKADQQPTPPARLRSRALTTNPK